MKIREVEPAPYRPGFFLLIFVALGIVVALFIGVLSLVLATSDRSRSPSPWFLEGIPMFFIVGAGAGGLLGFLMEMIHFTAWSLRAIGRLLTFWFRRRPTGVWDRELDG